MGVAFPIPFGPVQDPDYGLTSWSFVDDFITLDEDTTEHAARWFNVSTTTGTSTSLATDPTGAVALLTGAAVGSDAGLQLSGEPIAFQHAKDMAFCARWNMSSLTGGNVFIGLHEETAGGAFDVGSGASIVTNHIGFTAQHVASIFFDTADGSTQKRTDTTADLVADTYVVTAAKYTAADKAWRYYVDGVYYGKHVVDSDNLPADLTQLTFGIHNEYHAAVSTLSVDYIWVAGQR